MLYGVVHRDSEQSIIGSHGQSGMLRAVGKPVRSVPARLFSVRYEYPTLVQACPPTPGRVNHQQWSIRSFPSVDQGVYDRYHSCRSTDGFVTEMPLYVGDARDVMPE